MAQAVGARSAFLAPFTSLFSVPAAPARRGASRGDIATYRRFAEEIQTMLVYYAGTYIKEWYGDLDCLTERMQAEIGDAWSRQNDPVLTRIYDDYEQVIAIIDEFEDGAISQNEMEEQLDDAAIHMIASVREWGA